MCVLVVAFDGGQSVGGWREAICVMCCVCVGAVLLAYVNILPGFNDSHLGTRCLSDTTPFPIPSLECPWMCELRVVQMEMLARRCQRVYWVTGMSKTDSITAYKTYESPCVVYSVCVKKSKAE